MTTPKADPLKVILISTLVGTIVLELLLIVSIFMGNGFALFRSLAGIVAIIYVLLSITTYRRHNSSIAAWMITGFYFSIGATTSFIWGINAPVAILLLSFSLLLSALVLPIRYIFINAALIVGTLTVNQLMVSATVLRPTTAGLAAKSTFADLFIYTIIFAMFAVLIWLFANRIKTAFDELTQSKEIIERQNKRIAKELRLEKKRLRLAEIAKTSQLATFSEIGQYTSLLMHDLSNELAILKMRDENDKSMSFSETAKIIDEVDRLIERSRRALSHRSETRLVDELLLDIENNFEYHCEASNIRLDVTSSGRKIRLVNAQLLYQALSIIVKNAIDAYSVQLPGGVRAIKIVSRSEGKQAIVTIQDWAGGIPGYKDSRVFSGLRSTKKNGHGLGLHLCQLIIEEQLNGKITYQKHEGASLFTLTVPIG